VANGPLKKHSDFGGNQMTLCKGYGYG